jgi:uncharacterized protein involved in exopolysaccharide biosynthesis
MFQKARESAYLESTSLLFLLVRWRKPLAIVILSTLVLAFIFSGPAFITPKFRSSVIFFPSSTNSISKAILEESSSEKQDIFAYGEEEQAEQMLQILNSDEIRSRIIAKYDLMNHYSIDPSDAYPMTRLYDKFKENISFSRTEFMSVKIDVLDTDPQIAADVANDIASLLDSMKYKIQRSRAEEAFAIMKSAYDEKLLSIRAKEDSLKVIRQHGVMDFSTQNEILSSEYTRASTIFTNESASLPVLQQYREENDSSIVNTKARIKGAEARMKYLQGKLDNLTEYGGAVNSLNQQLAIDREELARIKKQYDKISVDVTHTMTPKFIVNRAEKAEKKSYPIRWLIVLVSIAVTFLLTVVTLLIIERVREIKYNL